MGVDRWSQIDRIFNAAVELPPEQRPAFLNDICASDHELRLEVESLLRSEESNTGFLERPAWQGLAASLAHRTPPPPPPHIPGYTILHALGEGGMGIVYLARQTAPIDRLVALKLVRFGMDTRQIIARFGSERQSLARMQHPNIAAVHDAGMTPDGRPYFVMEYVDGAPITDYCDAHQLSTHGRLSLFIEVCEAVQHAHQKGVIHRDLKPSNVLVTSQDGRARPKVIDFGIARAVDRSGSRESLATELGMVVGTPEYMSPEQASLSQDIDTTTDVYSLGVLLYELLTGVLPFDSTTLRKAGPDEMRRMIRESEPAKPSSRVGPAGAAADAVARSRRTDAARLTRQIKGDLDWITLKALEKDRRRRYQTAAELAADVSHYLADEPIVARPPSAFYRMRKFTRRYRTAVVGVAAVMLALVAGLAVSVTQFMRAEREAVSATRRAYAATIAAADAELRMNLPVVARERLLAAPVELRGWEWQHLFLRSDASLTTLGSAAACDDHNRINGLGAGLTLGNGGADVYLRRCASIERWSGVSHTHSTLAFTEDRPVSTLAVSRNGHVLVARATDTNATPSAWDVRLYEPGSTTNPRVFGPFPRAPICGDVSADGRRIAVGLQPARNRAAEPLDDVFETWDAATGRRLARLAPVKPKPFDTRFTNPVMCHVVFSPDAARVATSGATVHVWATDSGDDIHIDPVQAGVVPHPIAFDSAGTRLAIGRQTGLVDVLELDTQRLISLDGSRFVRVPTQLPENDLERRTLAHVRRRNEVLSIAFAPDGRRLITGTDVNVGIWDLQQHRLTEMLAGHDARVLDVAVADDGRLLSADESGLVRVWPVQASSAVTMLPGFGDHAGAIALSRNGSLIAIGQLDGGLSAWRLNDLQRIVLRKASGRLGDPPPARPILLTPDSRHVLAATDFDVMGNVTWWDTASGESATFPLTAAPEPGCQLTALMPQAGVTSMALTDDGRLLAFRFGTCVIVLDVATKRRLATLSETPSELQFHPNGALLVRVSPVVQDNRISDTQRLLLWDWRQGQVLSEVVVPGRFYNDPQSVISPDGQLIAVVGGNPSELMLWDGRLRQQVGRIPVPPNTRSAAFSPDGRRIATTGMDSTVRIWDTERRELLLILQDEDPHNAGLAFTPDGHLVVARVGGGLTIYSTKRNR